MPVEFDRKAITSIIKGPVTMGPTIRVGTLAAPTIPTTGIGSFAESIIPSYSRFNYRRSILEQANSVASAAWNGVKVPDVFQSALADVNLDPSINPLQPQTRTTPLTKEGVVAEAEHWLKQDRSRTIFAETGLRQAESVAQKAWEKPQPIEAVLPRPVSQVSPKTARRIASPSAYFASSTVATDQQVEQKETEAVAVRPLITEQDETSEDRLVKPKQVKEFRVSHTVDHQAVKIRLDRIKQAADKAAAEAESEGIYDQIEGWRIVKHIPSPQDKSLRGGELNEVDPKGDLPDGTWEANLANVAAISFTSVAAVVGQAPKIVAEDNPFIRGQGPGVTNENIATAYKHDPSKIHPAERVIKRVISMQKRIEESDIEEEGKIQEYPDLAAALLAT